MRGVCQSSPIREAKTPFPWSVSDKISEYPLFLESGWKGSNHTELVCPWSCRKRRVTARAGVYQDWSWGWDL
ncbi:hypothetical protein AV530_012664 [Patagioenas fasciata monilis]|uniref:Uncharacterized protein n=1 Tax=Patagioenas fasciata monilis TaxID=372326 RepID=A0A1V4JBQ0_PATFA|nr:hypothetical protein AV530_012664 [Patagioenas fasciata monilis]